MTPIVSFFIFNYLSLDVRYFILPLLPTQPTNCVIFFLQKHGILYEIYGSQRRVQTKVGLRDMAKDTGQMIRRRRTWDRRTGDMGTNEREIWGQGTNQQEIWGHGTNQQETLGHETNQQETLGLETNQQDTWGHGTNQQDTLGHETNRQETLRHKTNRQETGTQNRRWHLLQACWRGARRTSGNRRDRYTWYTFRRMWHDILPIHRIITFPPSFNLATCRKLKHRYRKLQLLTLLPAKCFFFLIFVVQSIVFIRNLQVVEEMFSSYKLVWPNSELETWIFILSFNIFRYYFMFSKGRFPI